MARKTAIVVCPGRGTYNREELGYLARHHGRNAGLLAVFDAERRALGQETISALDGASNFSLAKHSRGDNASALIYACSYLDFLAIDRTRYDVVAVTGNSMGWYTALACAGSLDAKNGFKLVNTMGALMQQTLAGGQVIYPFVDENWVEIPGKCHALLKLADKIPGLYVSIYLGGMIVFAGEEAALEQLFAELTPLYDRFPMRLKNHAGFHSPLQAPVSLLGKQMMQPAMFQAPDLPLIDGRGHHWQSHATSTTALYEYTLGHQVVAPYDFTHAITAGLREFAPDVVIIPGPGTTLGGAVAQCLIKNQWFGMTGKDEFSVSQKSDPILLSMGMESQRKLVTR